MGLTKLNIIHGMNTCTMKVCLIYLYKFLSELNNVRHVENEVYGRIYYEHQVTKAYT